MKKIALRAWVEGLGSVFLPELCPICRRDAPGAAGAICAGCRGRMEPLAAPYCSRCGVAFPGVGPCHPCGRCSKDDPPFASLRAWGSYSGPLLDAVRRFKYGGGLDLRRGLEELLVEAWRQFYGTAEAQAVCCVPCHPGTRRRRGFSTPALLSRALAASLGVPWQPEALVKVRQTADLVGLGAGERMAVVRGAFAWRRPLAGTVVLVDDVVTTTATARACAEACRDAGAEQVLVLALARTPWHGSSAPG